MKALVHNSLVKFVLEDTDQIDPHEEGIIIRTDVGAADIVVSDIPFGEVEEVLIPEDHIEDMCNGFYGGRFLYTDTFFRYATEGLD